MGLARRRTVASPRRRPLTYFSSYTATNAIRGATTISEVVAALSSFGTAYGLTFHAVTTAQSIFSGTYVVDAMGSEFLDHVKRGARSVVEEFAKYPPSFVLASQLEDVYLCKNPRKVNAAADDYAAGVTLAGDFYLNTTYTTVEGNIRHTVHHEFAHVIHNSWATEYNATATQWLAQNPGGFAYADGQPPNTFSTDHPAAFISSYARTSRFEDWAELHSKRANGRDWPIARGYLAGDSQLAAKAAVQDAFMQARHPDLGANWYALVNR